MKSISLNSLDQTDMVLMQLAISMRSKSYCPYSNYAVGAALIDIEGAIHTGCNIESADFTLTSHAEMVAIDSMVKFGSHDFRKIFIALHGKGQIPATPCGLCRQKLAEFNKSGAAIIVIINLNEFDELVNLSEFTLSELLPHSFSSDFLG